jgi:hypothetical protein
MNPNDLLAARISLITESVIHKDWGRARDLIEEWELDERSTEPLDHSPNDDIPGLQFGELAECFN